MKKLLQWTLFLDILGYGEEQKNIDNQKEADKFIEFMKNNKLIIELQESVDKDTYQNQNINIYDYYDFKSVFISDSLIITAIPTDKLFNEKEYYNFSTFIIMELTFKLLMLIEFVLKEKNLFFRGGISSKFTQVDIKNSLAVGKGLIEAYNIESKLADVPRILLSKEISNDKKIMSYFDKHSKEYGKEFTIFSKDTHIDDYFYLDYLGFILAFLNKSENTRLSNQNFDEKIHEIETIKSTTINTLKNLQNVIQLNLKKHSKNQSVLKKYIWLREYLNSSISKYSYLKYIQEYKITE